MAVFFIRTEQSAVGPFTGIELREAAMAGIIGADSVIGGGPQGPWFHAIDTGLFSEKKMPLPHPPGTRVPHYHITGLRVKVDGPFKLRELIGFAARGMMLADSTLQSDISPDWFPVERIPVLKACLDGRLVLLGSDGKVVRRATDANKSASTKPAIPPANIDTASPSKDSNDSAPPRTSERWQSEAEAPVAPVRDAIAPATIASTGHQSAKLVSSGSFEPGYVHESEQPNERRTTTYDPREDENEQPIRWWKKPIGISSLNPQLTLSRQVLVRMLIIAVLVGGIGTAYSQYKKWGMRAEHIVGNWIATDQSFVVAFREDGSCAVFNTSGNSWSGQYEWNDLPDDEVGPESLGSVSSEVDIADPDHEIYPVLSSDGYAKVSSSLYEPSYIDGHEVSDLFFRRDGDSLKIGYVTSVQWNAGKKQMLAGWVTVEQSPTIGVDAISEIAMMPIEPPPKQGFAVEKSPHLSEVAAKLTDMYVTGEYDESDSGSPCYSLTVNANFLLKNFGIPDEARPLYPFEREALPARMDFTDSQIVRYGVIKMILRSDGELQYVQLMP